jgi:Rrf2 family protein
LQLKTAGLVTSVRGAAGGYQLTRSPEDISMAAIINAIEKRTAAPRSALGEARRTPAVEVLLDVWRDLQQQEQRTLERLSLAELLRRSHRSDQYSYQI